MSTTSRMYHQTEKKKYNQEPLAVARLLFLTSTDRLHNNRLSMTPHLVRSQNAYKNVTIDLFHRDTWVSVHRCLTLRGSHLGNREGSEMMSYMCMCNFYIGVLSIWLSGWMHLCTPHYRYLFYVIAMCLCFHNS